MAKHPFTISPLQSEDVPTIAKFVAEAFESDRHTEMKSYGKVPCDMAKITLEGMPRYLSHPRCVVLKAVSDETGEVMGFVNWAFRGFDPADIPCPAGSPEKIEPNQPKESDSSEEGGNAEKEKGEEEEKVDKKEEEGDSVARLEALTSKDMDDWMETMMPEGTRCIYIVGLNVDPKYQRLGVGSALLKWGTDVVDKHGVFAWVHSSENGYPAYAKAGFEIERTLDLDLDEWAVAPPPADRDIHGDGKWGHYIIRYMVYRAKSS